MTGQVPRTDHERVVAALVAERDEWREQYRSEVSVAAMFNEQLEQAVAERDAAIAAVGEPCAECGHIDWRSDPNPLLEQLAQAVAERDRYRDALEAASANWYAHAIRAAGERR